MCASYGLDPRMGDYDDYVEMLDEQLLDGLREWAAENAGATVRPTGKNLLNLNPIIRPGGLELAWWSFNRVEGVDPRLNTINAKSERLLQSPTWRDAFKSRRCLIPVSHWYEYQKPSKARFALTTEVPFMVGGISAPGDTEAGRVSCYSMVMQPMPEHLEYVHDRMPVLIGVEFAAAWLDPNVVGDKAFRDEVLAASRELGETVTATPA